MEMYIPDELHFARRSRMSTGSVVVLRGYILIPKGLFVDYGVYLYEVLKDREHKSVSAISALNLSGTVRVTPASCLSVSTRSRPTIVYPSCFVHFNLTNSFCPLSPQNLHLHLHHPRTPFTSAFRSTSSLFSHPTRALDPTLTSNHFSCHSYPQ